MIAQRNTSHNPIEINEEGTIQAILAMLGQKTTVSVARWVCEVCGMVHPGQAPMACESCGHKVLLQQPDMHCEMNSHW